MPEKRVLTHVGKSGYLTSARCVISLARKQLASRLENLVCPHCAFGYNGHLTPFRRGNWRAPAACSKHRSLAVRSLRRYAAPRGRELTSQPARAGRSYAPNSLRLISLRTRNPDGHSQKRWRRRTPGTTELYILLNQLRHFQRRLLHRHALIQACSDAPGPFGAWRRKQLAVRRLSAPDLQRLPGRA